MILREQTPSGSRSRNYVVRIEKHDEAKGQNNEQDEPK